MADTSSSVAKIPPTEDPIVVFSEIENVNFFFTNLKKKIKIWYWYVNKAWT